MSQPADNYLPQTNGSVDRFNRFVWLVTLAFWAVLVILIIIAPVLRANHFESAANWIYAPFSYLCHQFSERSFHVEHEPLAVCARCFGVYFGLAFGVLIYPFVRSLNDLNPLPRVWLLLAPAPTTIDFLLGYFGIWQNTHFSRFATASVLGIGIAFFLVPGVIEISRFFLVSGKR